MLFALIFSFANSDALAISHDSTEVNLPLACHSIPLRSEQLCMAATTSSINTAVEDVVFYKRSKEGWLTFLEARKADIAVIYIAGFSIGGKYTILAEAEEGHPRFYIYETDNLLNPDTKPRIVGGISDYYLEYFIRLDDDGTALLSYRKGHTLDKNKTKCLNTETNPENAANDECQVKVNLIE